MPLFQYKAMSAEQQRVSGVVTADSPRDARDQLRVRGLIVEQVTEEQSRATKKSLFQAPWQKSQVSQIIRELSTLSHAGIPLGDALQTLIRQHKGSAQTALMSLRESVMKGNSLATAMEQQPRMFDRLAVNMIRVGENVGNLEQVLDILADFAERSMKFRNRVMSALLYPILVLVASIAVTLFLMTSVVPVLLDNLVEADRPLPLPTTILKVVSDFLLQYGLWLLVIFAIASAALITWLRSETGLQWKDKWILKLPLIGRIAFRQVLARTSYVIATLLRSGLDLTRSLEIATDSCQNRTIAKEFHAVREAIVTGRDLGVAFETSGMFPPLVVQIFAVGQQSGQLETMLERLSHDYEQQVETMSGRLATILEPIAILFLTGIVGFILLATILPVLEAGNAL